MRLSEEQIHDLVTILEPEFSTEAQRLIALTSMRQYVPQTDADITLYKQLNPADFASRLIKSLQSVRMKDKNSALIAFLGPYANGREETFEPFYATLRAQDEVIAPVPVARPDLPSDRTRRRVRRRRLKLSDRIRRSLAGFPWQLVAVIVVLGIVLPTAGMIVFASDAYTRVQESLGSLRRVVSTLQERSLSALTTSDFDRLQAGLNNFNSSLARAGQQTRLLRVFSGFNADLDTLFKLLDAGTALSGAAKATLDGLEPTLNFLSQGQRDRKIVSQISSGERLIEILQLGQGYWRDSEALLQKAEQALQGVTLPDSPQFLSLYLEIQEYQALIRRANRILSNLPPLLTVMFGVGEPADFLLLSQNNDELRPSGGYISTYGWLRVSRFRVVDYGYGETTRLSPNPPPGELVSEIKRPEWWFPAATPIMTAWSGSWYADFAKTAKMAAWYYNKGLNPRSPIKGVIGLDLTGFQMILEGLGEIRIDGFDQALTAANFRNIIYEIRAGAGDVDHKRFLAVAYRQILAQWPTLAQSKGLAILSGALKAMQEKHLMLYFEDPALNEVLNVLGWSGTQTPDSAPDYLMLADANLGNKSNSSVLREATYNVTVKDNGDLVSVLTVNYDFPTELAKNDPAVRPEHYGQQKDYYTILQAFVPAKASFVRSEYLQAPLTVDAQEKTTILVTGLRVGYGASASLRFEYTQEARLETFGPYKRYQLLLQKQPGTRAESAIIQVNLPGGAKVVNTSPEPIGTYQVQGLVLEFRVNLNVDQVIDIIFK